MFTRVDRPLSVWSRIVDTLPGHTIFQSPEWLSFVAESQHAEPVVAELRDGSGSRGFFAGLMVRRCGLKVLGSPLPGWTTSYMGMNLSADVYKPDAIAALIRFAFEELGCVHLEMMDRHITFSDVQQLGLSYSTFAGFEIDLTQPEDALLGRMSATYRRRIRRVSKIGVTIEEARDPAFADEYYDQLEAVFERQQLAPPYGRDRVTRLLASVAGTGRLLLLRARDAAGRCIATAIFPAMNDTMYFWGGATARDCGRAHPNEAVHWYAMRYWKQRGIKRYDMGGAGEYKRKFGAYEIAVPWFRTSRYPGLPMMREAVRRVFAWRQIIVGKAHHLRGYVPSLPIPLSSPSER